MQFFCASRQDLLHALNVQILVYPADMASLAKFCDSADTTELANELGMKPLQVQLSWLICSHSRTCIDVPRNLLQIEILDGIEL